MRRIRRGIRRHAAPFLVGLTVGLIFSSLFFAGQKKRSSLATPTASFFDFRPEYELVIVILSSIGYTDRRHAIRDSWLSMTSSSVPELAALSAKVKPLFVVGSRRQEPGILDAAHEENSDHNDMLFVDSSDDFDSLTSKVLKAYTHIAESYRAKYVLKVDDDSYVNLPALMSELSSKPEEKFYWGYFQGRANVKKQGKYEEGGWFLCDRYLPYALGGGYVLSFDLVQYVAEMTDIARAYRAEDVTVGTWLAPLNITRQHDVRFDTEYRSRGCLNSYLITHKKSPLAMDELHSVFVSSGGKRLCSQEVVHLRPYVYNWDVLPTKCCERPLDAR